MCQCRSPSSTSVGQLCATAAVRIACKPQNTKLKCSCRQLRDTADGHTWWLFMLTSHSCRLQLVTGSRDDNPESNQLDSATCKCDQAGWLWHAACCHHSCVRFGWLSQAELASGQSSKCHDPKRNPKDATHRTPTQPSKSRQAHRTLAGAPMPDGMHMAAEYPYHTLQALPRRQHCGTDQHAPMHPLHAWRAAR